jgi:hypothetical protein
LRAGSPAAASPARRAARVASSLAALGFFLILFALDVPSGAAFASSRAALRPAGAIHIQGTPIASAPVDAGRGVETIRRSPRIATLKIADGSSAIVPGSASVSTEFSAVPPFRVTQNRMIEEGEATAPARGPPPEARIW